MTVVMGQLVALALMLVLQRLVLSPGQLEQWGWRIPFAIGGALAVFALYLEARIAGDRRVRAKRREGRAARMRVRRNGAALLALAGSSPASDAPGRSASAIGGTVAFATRSPSICRSYMVNTAGFSRDTATLITAALRS